MIEKELAVVLLLVSCVLLTFAALKVISKKKYGFFGMAFVVYHLLFLCLPALFHVINQEFPFYNARYSGDLQLTAAVIILIFLLSVFSIYFTLKEESALPVAQRKPAEANVRIFLSYVLVIVGFAIQVAVLNVFGAETFLVSRDEFSREMFSDVGFLQAIVVDGVRSLSFATLLLNYWVFRKRLFLHSAILSIFTVIPFFVINYPLALSRYKLFAYILCVLFIMCRPTRLNKLLLFMGFAVGTVTVFPLVSYITRGKSEQFISGVYKYYTESGDFDGFQSILNVINYTQVLGFKYGEQMLGALLVFFPRIYWSGKPEPTGKIAAALYGYPFTNISAPLLSEWYIDFGVFGIILFGAALGYFLRKLDSISASAKSDGNERLLIMTALMFAFSIIIFRGSLMAISGAIFLQAGMAYFIFSLAIKKR